MLAHLRAELVDSPGFLVHRSTIFNEVDERQATKALQLKATKAAGKGFQYIVTLNLDQVPYGDFSEEFKEEFDGVMRVKFTEAMDDGGVLGITIRFQNGFLLRLRTLE